MLRNYFKIAFRTLSKNRAYTAINIVGLSIGICACVVIYLLVSFELSHDTFHADKERIYRVVSHIGIAGETYKNSGVAAPLPWAAKREMTGAEVVSAFHVKYIDRVFVPLGNGKTKTIETGMGGWEPDKMGFIAADPQYFGVFKYGWLVGNPKQSLAEPFKVVLTESRAKVYFGDTPLDKIIGRTLRYADFGDTVTVSISGIVEDWKQNTDLHFTDFISLTTIQKTKWKDNAQFESWTSTNSSSQMFVKLAGNTTPRQVVAQLNAIKDKNIKDPADRKGRRFLLQPLADIHYNADFGGDYVRLAHLPTLYALMGVAGFLLLIAAINFINLATAQSARRAKEIGVRKVLGSSRAGLILQFMSEAFLIVFCAVLLSLLCVNPVLSAFKDFIPTGVEFHLLRPEILLFTLAITVAATFLSGFYPALVLSSYLPVLSLKGQTNAKGSQKAYLRKTLIVFQFSISTAFIMATIIVGTQINFMLGKNMGFKKDEIVHFETNWQDKSNRKRVLLNELRQLPEVEMASLSYSTPARQGYSTTTLTFNNGKKKLEVTAHQKSGDAEFVKLYGIKIVAGRNISDSDTIREFLINETFARQLGFKNPAQAIGQFLSMNENVKLPIVGVVADFHVQSLHTAIQPVFIASQNKYSTTISIRLRTKGRQVGDFKGAMAKVEGKWKKLFPGEKFQYAFFDATIAKFYENERKIARIVNTATFLAIFIACLGLFGLVTFTAEQRTKETGIRKILGASVSQIVALLSKDFLVLVLIAFVIAVPIAWYGMNRWLQDFAYRIEISWWVFALSGVVAVFIALLTVSFQAVKAALANPVKSLRSE